MAKLFNISIASLALVCVLVVVKAQSDDYGENDNSGGGDNEGYGNYGSNNDDSFNNQQPNQQSGVNAEGSENAPANSYSPQSQNDADGDYDNDDAAGAASNIQPTIVKRVRRSAPVAGDLKTEESIEAPKLRVKRWGKSYIGPVYTYVKTDKHANFKWGVKHKVGKKHG